MPRIIHALEQQLFIETSCLTLSMREISQDYHEQILCEIYLMLRSFFIYTFAFFYYNQLL